jgi:cytochrome c oxidase subunit 1/cytochrome c oxidase subunit I+III
VIASRHPLWEGRLNEGTGRSSLEKGFLLADGKEAMGTTAMDATPDIIMKMPDDTYAPFVLGLAGALFFACLLLHWRLFAGFMAGAVLVATAFWLWPRRELLQRIDGGVYE